MKCTALIAAGVAGLLLTGYLIGRTETGRLYPATMIVDEVSDGVVYMSTESGHCYSYYGASDEEVGDIMSVLMDDNGTPLVMDDKVVAIRYSGF